MTTADRTAVDALARHFAYADGEWWEHLNDREQATYRARALDVVQVVGPIYQAPAAAMAADHDNKVAALAPIEERRTMADSARHIFADHAKVLDSFPRPRSADR